MFLTAPSWPVSFLDMPSVLLPVADWFITSSTGRLAMHSLRRPGTTRRSAPVLCEAKARRSMRVLAYCLLPQPLASGPLAAQRRRPVGMDALAHGDSYPTFACRLHTSGTGPLYQGRFKSFPVSGDEHFLQVCRYVERNALRTNLVERAEDWRWGSLWEQTQAKADTLLAAWPVDQPPGWDKIRQSHGDRG